MKNLLKKELKSINLNFNSKKIIKQPLKILKKINLKKFGKVTTKSLSSLTKTYENFKKKQKIKEINKINFEKKEKIKAIKKEKLQQIKQKLDEERQIKKDHANKLKEEKQRLQNQ